MFGNTDTNGCGIGGKLMYFVLGGSIGAAIALLFAPKSGKELRGDIAEAAAKGYEETRDGVRAVTRKSGEMFDAIADKAVDLKQEIIADAEKFGDTVMSAVTGVSDSIRRGREI